MRVIHAGTVVETTFEVVDDNDDVVSKVKVGTNVEVADDPLTIKSLTAENFVKAQEALVETRNNLKEQIAEQEKKAAEEAEKQA
jgi:hypothetical protein